jgi:hypothetical protein
MLVRLLYVSRSMGPESSAHVEAISQQARDHNVGHGITGILCYSGDLYLQVLEGGRAAVNALYGKILSDKRHKDVVLLKYDEITERRFSGWTMGHANMTKLNPSLLLKYSELPELNPYAVSGEVSMALLDELIATAAIVGRS